MNLSCVICAELFCHSDDVHVTHCGHIFHQTCLLQWFERSKTCPQCRNKCNQKSHHKIYFNLANLDTSSIDIGSIQQQLDEAKLQIQISSKEVDKYKKEIEELKNTRKKCMGTITALESKLESNKFTITQFSEQIKVLKSEIRVVEAQRKEITELKKQIELMETVQTIISATSSEVEKLLEKDSKPQSLATLVVMLKKELRACESKKTDIHNTLKKIQYDLRKTQENKRNLESKLSGLESENYQLTSKLETLENVKKSESSSSQNSKYNEDGSLKTCRCVGKSLLNNKKESFIELNDSFSPGIPKKVKEIEDSDSPYLNIKSSSLGLHPILKVADRVRNNNKKDGQNLKSVEKPDSIFVTHSNFGTLKKSRSDVNDKYSIFKKPRLLEQSTTNDINPILAFNGIGGSEKKLSSPTKSLLFQEELRPKLSNINNRLKAGKLRKNPSSTKLSIDMNIEKFVKKT